MEKQQKLELKLARRIIKGLLRKHGIPNAQPGESQWDAALAALRAEGVKVPEKMSMRGRRPFCVRAALMLAPPTREPKPAKPKVQMNAPRIDTSTLTIEGVSVMSKEFLSTYAWRRVRMLALKLHGARCMCCGASPATGAVMNVDHIKPRKLFPHLALDVANLQVLCHECNHGKGNWDDTDWRPDDRLDPVQSDHMKSIRNLE